MRGGEADGRAGGSKFCFLWLVDGRIMINVSGLGELKSLRCAIEWLLDLFGLGACIIHQHHRTLVQPLSLGLPAFVEAHALLLSSHAPLFLPPLTREATYKASTKAVGNTRASPAD